MVLIGLVLIVLGALAVVAAVFTAEIHNGHVELLGANIGPVALFLVGLGAGLAILWGFSIFKWGTKRSWAQRKEAKRMSKLADKVEQTEQSRREDTDEEIKDADRDSRRTL